MACWESDLNINAGRSSVVEEEAMSPLAVSFYCPSFVLVLLYLSGLFRCKGGEDRVVER